LRRPHGRRGAPARSNRGIACRPLGRDERRRGHSHRVRRPGEAPRRPDHAASALTPSLAEFVLMPDHYAYPGTDVLVNLPGITDRAAWKDAETLLVVARLSELLVSPIPGRFDL